MIVTIIIMMGANNMDMARDCQRFLDSEVMVSTALEFYIKNYNNILEFRSPHCAVCSEC